MSFEPFYVTTLLSSPDVGACVGRVDLPPGPVRHAEAGTRNGSVVVTAGENADSLLPSGTGADIVHGLGGRCSGFVADPPTRTAFLFNDRYGRERIFVHSDGDRTFFASEAKAILAVAARTRAFDPVGLAEYLACGCTFGVRSLFQNIEVLDPGTVVTFTPAGIERRRYFHPSDLEGLEPASPAQFVEGFLNSFRRAVNQLAMRQPSAGISLTGGLDSRMIMACLDSPPDSVPCYTFGSMYRTTGDVALARQVAECCRQPHHVLELGREFLRNAPATFEQSVYASDGYLGLSGASELHVNRQARALAPSRMSGNWGGELMRGVRAFKYSMPKGDFMTPELAGLISASAASFVPSTTHPLSGTLFHQIPFQGYGRYAIERSQAMMRSPFLADDVVEWLYRAPNAIRASSANVVIGQRQELLAIPTDLGLLGDRWSAGRNAVRRALIKAEYWTSHGAPDWVAAVASALPSPVLETRFLGVDKFQHFRFWTRRQLAPFVRETLTGRPAAALGEWFDMSKVARLVDDHVSGRANYTDAIDKLMTLTVARQTLFRGVRAEEGAKERAGRIVWNAIGA